MIFIELRILYLEILLGVVFILWGKLNKIF